MGERGTAAAAVGLPWTFFLLVSMLWRRTKLWGNNNKIILLLNWNHFNLYQWSTQPALPLPPGNISDSQSSIFLLPLPFLNLPLSAASYSWFVDRSIILSVQWAYQEYNSSDDYIFFALFRAFIECCFFRFSFVWFLSSTWSENLLLFASLSLFGSSLSRSYSEFSGKAVA